MFFARSAKDGCHVPRHSLVFVQYYTGDGAGTDSTRLQMLTWEKQDRLYDAVVLPNTRSHKFAVVEIDMLRKLEHIVPVWGQSTAEKKLFYVNKFASFE
jgi:hypothetical protein